MYELAFKIILAGYLDGGLVEYLPCNDYGLGWVSRGSIACKIWDLARYEIRSSYGVGTNSKVV